MSGIAGGIRRGLGRGLEALFKPANETDDPDGDEEAETEAGADERSDAIVTTLQSISSQATQHLEAIRRLEEAARALTQEPPKDEHRQPALAEKPLHVWTPVEGYSAQATAEGSPPQQGQPVDRGGPSLTILVSGLTGFAALAEIADRLPRSTPGLECNLVAYEGGDAELQLLLPEDASSEQALQWVKQVVADIPDGKAISVTLQPPPPEG